MLNPLAPYMLWLKLGLAGVLLGAAFLGGCHVQAGRDAAKIEGQKTALLQAASQLGDARDSLRAAATTFGQISAQTRANAKAAAEQIKAGNDQAKRAKADKVKSDQRAAKLEKQLLDERAECQDAGRRICGIPLQ